MSVNMQNQNLRTDIKDFIQLLQRNPQNSNERRKFSLDSDRLSVIYSASEPESSLADKENSHNSANKIDEVEESEIIIKQIKRLGVTAQQEKHLQKIARMVTDLRKTVLTAETKYKSLYAQFEEEKSGTDQILKALVKLDEAEKQIWASYNELTSKYASLQEKYIDAKEECEMLRAQVADNSKDIQFMRKLVLVANENYESIQRKCKNLERSSKMLERYKEQRSSPEIVSRSTIVNKKSSCSPSISDRSNMSVQKGSFQQNYRKLVLRTLKSKALR